MTSVDPRNYHWDVEGYDDEDRAAQGGPWHEAALGSSCSFWHATNSNVFVVSHLPSGQWVAHRTGMTLTLESSFYEYLKGMDVAREAWLQARSRERFQGTVRATSRLLAHFQAWQGSRNSTSHRGKMSWWSRSAGDRHRHR